MLCAVFTVVKNIFRVLLWTCSQDFSVHFYYMAIETSSLTYQSSWILLLFRGLTVRDSCILNLASSDSLNTMLSTRLISFLITSIPFPAQMVFPWVSDAKHYILACWVFKLLTFAKWEVHPCSCLQLNGSQFTDTDKSFLTMPVSDSVPTVRDPWSLTIVWISSAVWVPLLSVTTACAA